MGRRRVHRRRDRAGFGTEGRTTRPPLHRSCARSRQGTRDRRLVAVRPQRRGLRLAGRRAARLTGPKCDPYHRTFESLEEHMPGTTRGEAVSFAPAGAAPADLGRFGEFGGRFVPETLVPALEELEIAFRTAWADDDFRAELAALLRDYAGRPTPVTECARLSEVLGVRVLLKREDLTHTGSHKIGRASCRERG